MSTISGCRVRKKSLFAPQDDVASDTPFSISNVEDDGTLAH